MKANQAPEKGTGWHRHEAAFHIVVMLKGLAKFMYEDQDTLVNAGDCVHQRPGIVHFLYDYSPDMEYLEIVGPAGFTTIDMTSPASTPEPATVAGGCAGGIGVGGSSVATRGRHQVGGVALRSRRRDRTARSELHVEFGDFVRLGAGGGEPLMHFRHGHDGVAVAPAGRIKRHVVGEKACDDRRERGIGHAAALAEQERAAIGRETLGQISKMRSMSGSL